MVLTTPDANRTMLSYLGTQHEVAIGSALEAAISSARMLLIEGYVWEMPNAAASIARAIEIAQRAGTLVVLTAGDAGCVQRNRDALWGALRQGADVLFTNKCGSEPPPSPRHVLHVQLVCGPCPSGGIALRTAADPSLHTKCPKTLPTVMAPRDCARA
jgi:sugar/nucleoside kinase (ribokinase family)